MVDFKKDSWFYALIAAILALIAILTPWGVADSGMGFDVTGWLTGMVTYYGDPVDMWIGAGLQAWTFGLTMMSIAALLLLSISTWKGKEWKWDWLIYVLAGIAMLIFPILALILEATEDAVIGFAPIGIIIAGVLSIVAFVIDKFVGGE
ncbi:MAG: hypothetical protein KAT57_08140 [Candidatus Lokiarchaeota archaeon]|nr:hypothetical protein [Candidatus Lokiarchaeota archaeon]